MDPSDNKGSSPQPLQDSFNQASSRSYSDSAGTEEGITGNSSPSPLPSSLTSSSAASLLSYEVTSAALPASASSNTSTGIPVTLASVGASTSMISSVIIHADGKDAGALGKKIQFPAIAPVPNIKPIISITPVVSSPTTRERNNHAIGVPVLFMDSTSVSHSRNASTKMITGSSDCVTTNNISSNCQVAPVPLTTKPSSFIEEGVTNGKTQNSYLGTCSPSLELKASSDHFSEDECQTGDSSEGNGSSNFSNESSDDNRDCSQANNESQRDVTTSKKSSSRGRVHHFRVPTANHQCGVAAIAIDGNSNIGLPLELSSSITLTPVMPASPPMAAPLNLSLKPTPPCSEQNRGLDCVSRLSHNTVLHSSLASHSYKGAKRGPKPKHLKAAMADETAHLRQKQEELKAHLEAQLKHQQIQLRMNRKGGGQNSCQSSQPEIRIQTSVGQGNSVVITTTAPPSSSSKSSHSPTIITMTKSANNKAISLLASTKTQEPLTTSVHSVAAVHPKPKGFSRLEMSNGTTITPSLANKDNCQDELHTHFTNNSVIHQNGPKERKLVAKFRTLEAESSEDESSEDSMGETGESSSVTNSSGESEASSSDTELSRDTASSTSKGRKRDYDGDSSSPRKRRKYIVSDERELRIPLEHGWRRLTKIRTYSYSGVRGEVVYFGPCGKKLKTYPEVVRYLEKNGINDITRENFTFSSKHNVGEFLEPLGNGEYLPVGEAEVITRIEEFRVRKGRRYVPLTEKRGDKRRLHHEENKLRKKEEERLQKRLEEQAAEARRQKEHLRFVRQQEKMERLEHQRVEKEIKAQQIQEARRKRQEMLDKQRVEETLRKNKEREMKRMQAVLLREQELQKRREMLMMVDLERERRRQHMLLVKALENRKRQEERERMKEERINEKRLNKELKLEQRRLEMQMIKELKKPVEDMELIDAEPLPKVDRIPGIRVAGKAFADILMVYEFLHNFGETLGFDMDSLPTLTTLQKALLNDESCEEELLSVLHHLLICAIDDPGIPPGIKGTTMVGQSLKEVDITSSTVSEILRIYIHANEGDKCPMLHWISTKPFVALTPTQKAAIVAYLCNELLCSRSICRQIDNNIEMVNGMRRDKWIVEGKVRKLKILQAKKIERRQTKMQHKEDKPMGKEMEESKDCVNSEDLRSSTNDKEGPEDYEEVRNDSGNESEGSRNTGTVEGIPEADESEEEDSGETIEELGKKIDKFSKQQNQYRRKLLKATQQLRAISFGQDRYRRRYWLIPHAGGIFVEGMESAELPEDCSHVEVQGHANENEHVAQTTGKDSICFEDTKLKKTEKIENTDTVVLCKNEQQDVPQSAEFSVETKLKKDDIPFTSSNLKIVHEQSCDKKDSVILDKSEKEKMESLPTTTVVNVFQSPKVLDTQSRTPKFAPISECVGDVRINNHEMQSTPMFGSDSVLSETSLVFPKEINGILANHHHHHQIKEEGGNAGQNGNFCESFLSAVPQYHISAEQILKSFAERQNHKPWFSILPRMPCDETSLTRIHPTVGGNCTNATATLFNSHPNRTSPVVSLTQSNKFSSLSTSSSSSQKYSPLPFGPLGFHNNAAFVAFQVGMIKKLSHGCGSPLLVPPDLNLGTTNNYSDPYFAARNGFVPLAGSPVTSYLRPGVSTRSASPYSDVTAIDNLTQQQQQQQQRKVQPIPKEMTKGWWRITDADQLKALVRILHPCGIREKMLHIKLQKYLDIACDACGKTQDCLDFELTDADHLVSEECGEAPDADKESDWNRDVALRADIAILDQVENLEEKVAGASMQLKQWKLPSKVTEDENVQFYLSSEQPPECGAGDKSTKVWQCAFLLAKNRLLDLEENIERRYIKPPLGYSSGQVNLNSVPGTTNVGNNAAMSQQGTEEKDLDMDEEPVNSPLVEDIPEGLLRWRAAVQKSRTSSQLAVCLNFLESCIAWERSIMKASCQFCNSGDNEAMLLLCDGCDKGYHTYCFKPKIETIPDGDWFCYECLNKSTGDRVCLYCGKKGKTICSCDSCYRAYHTECMEPPLARVPKGRWLCPRCSCKTSKGKGKNRKNKEAKDGSSESDDSPRKGEKAPRYERPKERNKNSLNKDVGPCRIVLAELETHEDAWPFLLPVNTKQFPSYRKIIKKPMDLSTIHNKLENGAYKSRGDFVGNVRLMFDNCETFNEDDSPVGKAGHNMRAFFEARWAELTEKCNE